MIYDDADSKAKIATLEAALAETTRQCQHFKQLAQTALPDRQGGESLRRELIDFISSQRQHDIAPALRDAILNKVIALPLPTRDAAEGAEMIVPHEDCLNCRCPPDQRCAGVRVIPAASPKPAPPDVMREALEQIEAMQVGHAATLAREALKASAPVPSPDGALDILCMEIERLRCVASDVRLLHAAGRFKEYEGEPWLKRAASVDLNRDITGELRALPPSATGAAEPVAHYHQ